MIKVHVRQTPKRLAGSHPEDLEQPLRCFIRVGDELLQALALHRLNLCHLWLFGGVGSGPLAGNSTDGRILMDLLGP